MRSLVPVRKVSKIFIMQILKVQLQRWNFKILKSNSIRERMKGTTHSMTYFPIICKMLIRKPWTIFINRTLTISKMCVAERCGVAVIIENLQTFQVWPMCLYHFEWNDTAIVNDTNEISDFRPWPVQLERPISQDKSSTKSSNNFPLRRKYVENFPFPEIWMVEAVCPKVVLEYFSI